MNRTFANRRLILAVLSAALVLALHGSGPLQGQGTGGRAAEADKLHVVLLVAGNDKGIGSADMKDVAAMKQAISSAFAKDKNRLVFHDLTGISKKTGKVYSANEILAHLKNMKIGNNDNVLVYHSGHGGIADRSRPEASHILTVDGGQLHRKDIRTIVAARQPRALMILTDCCSSYMSKSEEAELVSLEEPPPASVNTATVRGLLLKASGIVNITAAQDGKEASSGHQGENPGHAASAFTVALLRLWYQQDTTFTTWEKMFPTLRRETSKASGGKHQARAFQIRTQTTPAATGELQLTTVE
jgi:hypothetical protein